MKHISARVLSFIIVLALCAGMLAGFASAAGSTVNTGTRHVVCQQLSSQAKAYYTGSYTWENLSALSGTATNSSVTACGSPLFNALQTLMSTTLTKTVTYSSLTSYWETTDRSGGSSDASLFYSDTISSSYNREHVWPKSRGNFYESGAGSDLHHLRPTDSTINSTRGNHTFGNVKQLCSSYSTKDYNGRTVLWYDSSYSGSNCKGLVEVNDNIKGDVARILLYVYVTYGKSSGENLNLFTRTSSSGSGNSANDGNKVIYDLDTLLQWCQNDPVDTWEMSRNDCVQNVQGNRNVFIDYPEFAWLLFNRALPSDYVTPSGNAMNGTTPTEPTTAPTEPTTAPTEPTTAPTEPTTAPTEPTTSPIEPSGNEYVLTTSLKDGDEVVIYNASAGKAMSEDAVSTNYRAGVAVTPSGNKIVTDDSKIVWKVKASGEGYTFANDAGETLSATKGLSFATTDNVWAINAANTANSVYIVSTTATGTSGDPKYVEWYSNYSEFSTYYYNTSSEAIFAMQLFVKGGSTTPIEPTTAPTEPTTAPTQPTTAPSGNEYALATSLKDGDEVIIYNAGSGMAMSEDAVSTNYRAGTAVTPSGNKIVTSDSKIVWKVAASGSGFTFANDAGETLSATKGLSFAATDNVWAVNPAATANSVYLVSTTATGTSGDPKYVEWYSNYSEFSTYYYNTNSEAIFAMQLFVKGGSVTPTEPTTAPTEPTTAPTEPTTAPTEAPDGSFVLSSSIKGGDEVVIYNPGHGMAIKDENDNNWYLVPETIQPTGNKIYEPSSALVWTVVDNGDGTYSFTNGADKIVCWVSGNYFELTNDANYEGADGKWKVSWTDGLAYIQHATFSNSYGPAYIECYYNSSKDKTNVSGYSSSDPTKKSSDFGWQFFVKNGGGSVTPTTPTEPTTAPTEPTSPTEPFTPTGGCQHTYVDTKVAATCTEPGYTLHTCSKCGDSYRTDFTELASHNYVNGVCSNCGAADPNYKPDDDIDYQNNPLYASFKDLEKDGWYRPGIIYCLSHGLMNGIGQPNQNYTDTFDPNGNVTRAMLVTIVYRAAGTPSAKGIKIPFEDVEPGVWYTDAVAWAADNEIVKGVSEDTFAPYRYITREQLATILYRYKGEPEATGNLAGYSDAGKVSEYALTAMKWAIGEEIIKGIDDKLAPQEYATRAQIATMMFRFLDPAGAKAAEELLKTDPNPFD